MAVMDEERRRVIEVRGVRGANHMSFCGTLAFSLNESGRGHWRDLRRTVSDLAFNSIPCANM